MNYLSIENIRVLSISDKKLLNQVIPLYNQGLSNRSIAKSLNYNHHDKIGRLFRRYGISPNGSGPQKINIVGYNKAKCSRCEEVKSIKNFQLNKRGVNSKHIDYRNSYCNYCRLEKINLRLRRDIKTFINNRMNRIKAKCLRNKLEFNLDIEYCLKQFSDQNGKCFYTDLHINWKEINGLRPDCLSFDRVDCNLGYLKGNVVFCTKRINSIKLDMSLEEMSKWTPDWYLRANNFLNQQNIKSDIEKSRQEN